MCKLLDQHKDCHVSNLKKTSSRTLKINVITENSKFGRLPELVETLLFEELNLPKYAGICFYCIYPPSSDFF